MALTATDRKKLTLAGYTLIRPHISERTVCVNSLMGGTERIDVTTYLIKQSTSEQFNWHDRNICQTKAELSKRLDQLLRDPKVILDE